jgi:hypothetical protein
MKSIRYLGGGGPLDPYMAAVQMAGQTFDGIADLADPGNEFGTQNMGTQISKGGVHAGVPGAILGAINAKKQLNFDKNRRIWDQMDQTRNAAATTYNAVAANPALLRGNGSSYYAFGGSLKPLNSNSVEIEGPSHEQGGVQLQPGVNVEGKETIGNGYVFSERLGFAQAHKKIATAIGKIEAKPLTAERVLSLQKLREREAVLAQGQELLKKALNITDHA